MSEPQAWIIVADRTNMEHYASLGIFGLNHGSQLPKMKIRDKIVSYIRKGVNFSGVGEIKKEYYLENKTLFEGGLFPNRVGIQSDLLPQNKAVNVWKIVDELEFSKGKLNWQGALAGGMRKIPLANFDAIKDSFVKTLASIGQEHKVIFE